MRRLQKTIACIIAAWMLVIGLSVTTLPVWAEQDTGIETFVAETQPRYGCEWRMIVLARSGSVTEEMRREYYDSITGLLREQDSDRLSEGRPTENAKVVMALTALGYDARDVGGYDLVASLEDLTWISAQGVNGAVYALLAMDSGAYSPRNSVREELIGAICREQTADGGFTFYGDAADADMTAMALQALGPYRDREDVRQTVEDALLVLSEMQAQDGGYGYPGEASNCESTAQVVVALAGLGIDPASDSRFVKDGNSVMTALYRFRLPQDWFAHETGGTADAMATEQGWLAMIADERFRKGQSPLYDMSETPRVSAVDPAATGARKKDDAVDASGDGANGSAAGIPLAAGLAVVVCAALIYRRRHT